MNTIRPILKKQMEYDFTEIIIGKGKATLPRMVKAKDKGEKYRQPYLIESN